MDFFSFFGKRAAHIIQYTQHQGMPVLLLLNTFHWPYVNTEYSKCLLYTFEMFL